MDENSFNAGAVWHGPWHTGLVSGAFGTAGNQHWAMALGKKISPKNLAVSEKAFFPFTSKKHAQGKTVLILPPGTVSFGRNCKSFLLPIRLVVRKTDLKRRFKFTTFIPDEIYQRAIRNYKQILEARKKIK